MSASSAPNRKEDNTPAFAVNNIKNCIPVVLSFEDGQYESWVEHFQIHAYACNVLDHIDPSTPHPSTIDEPTWKRLDAVVKRWIYGTISEGLQQIIMKPGASAEELWKHLKRIFQGENNTTYIDQLQEAFDTIRLRNFSSMLLYYQRLEKISNELAKFGRPISESKMTQQLLDGLTGEYSLTATMIRLTVPLPNFDSACTFLLWEETRQSSPQQLMVTTLSPPRSHSKLIYKAASGNDWDSASEIFGVHQELMSEPINCRSETPLMVAVGTNSSHDFVQRLLERLGRDDLVARDHQGNTAPHYAAKVGNVMDAKRLVACDRGLTSITNSNGEKAVMLAALQGRKEVTGFLLGVTAFRAIDVGNVVPSLIFGGLIDIALTFAYQVSLGRLASQSSLSILATKPELFPIENEALLFAPLELLGPLGLFGFYAYKSPAIFNNIYDMKVKHLQTSVLVELILKGIIDGNDDQMAREMVNSTITTAISYGACDLIERCIMAHGQCRLEETPLFHFIINQRLKRAYNIVHLIAIQQAFPRFYFDGKKREKALHITAKLAPRDRLNNITEAALQMQWELQWYKDVERLVGPLAAKSFNIDQKTPRMIFTEEHKDLLIEGQQWMKDQAASFSVIAALIITMTFAAAFQIPGGNNDDGKPVFLEKGAFMVFIKSNAIAFISSSTSVLKFLGVFNSRYTEEDFLYALPRRMAIGLASLLFSLVATLVAFGATLALMLQEKVSWIIAPIVIVLSIPLYLFGWMQFTLLVQLGKSIYGPRFFFF